MEISDSVKFLISKSYSNKDAKTILETINNLPDDEIVHSVGEPTYEKYSIKGVIVQFLNTAVDMLENVSDYSARKLYYLQMIVGTINHMCMDSGVLLDKFKVNERMQALELKWPLSMFRSREEIQDRIKKLAIDIGPLLGNKTPKTLQRSLEDYYQKELLKTDIDTPEKVSLLISRAITEQLRVNLKDSIESFKKRHGLSSDIDDVTLENMIIGAFFNQSTDAHSSTNTQSLEIPMPIEDAQTVDKSKDTVSLKTVDDVFKFAETVYETSNDYKFSPWFTGISAFFRILASFHPSANPSLATDSPSATDPNLSTEDQFVADNNLLLNFLAGTEFNISLPKDYSEDIARCFRNDSVIQDELASFFCVTDHNGKPLRVFDRETGDKISDMVGVISNRTGYKIDNNKLAVFVIGYMERSKMKFPEYSNEINSYIDNFISSDVQILSKYGKDNYLLKAKFNPKYFKLVSNIKKAALFRYMLSQTQEDSKDKGKTIELIAQEVYDELKEQFHRDVIKLVNNNTGIQPSDDEILAQQKMSESFISDVIPEIVKGLGNSQSDGHGLHQSILGLGFGLGADAKTPLTSGSGSPDYSLFSVSPHSDSQRLAFQNNLSSVEVTAETTTVAYNASDARKYTTVCNLQGGTTMLICAYKKSMGHTASIFINEQTDMQSVFDLLSDFSKDNNTQSEVTLQVLVHGADKLHQLEQLQSGLNKINAPINVLSTESLPDNINQSIKFNAKDGQVTTQTSPNQTRTRSGQIRASRVQHIPVAFDFRNQSNGNNLVPRR